MGYPILTIPEIFSTWIRVGGNTGSLAIYMTAIALAESGGNATVISSSGDFGLWQINQSAHAGEFPRLWPQWDDPISNARMAKAISGNGQNVGPWCTAWDPGLVATHCGHYKAPPPDALSPAGKLVAHVAAVLHTIPPPVAGTAGGPAHTPGVEGWSHWQGLLGDTARQWRDQMTEDHHRMRGRH